MDSLKAHCKFVILAEAENESILQLTSGDSSDRQSPFNSKPWFHHSCSPAGIVGAQAGKEYLRMFPGGLAKFVKKSDIKNFCKFYSGRVLIRLDR